MKSFLTPFHILGLLAIAGFFLFYHNRKNERSLAGAYKGTPDYPSGDSFISLVPKAVSEGWSNVMHFLSYNTPTASQLGPAPLPQTITNSIGYSAYDNFGNTQNQSPQF